MPTPVLNNGIYVRDTQYNFSNHIDRAHLFQFAPEDKTDLGVIDIWAMVQKKEMPLYSMSSFSGKNTILTDTTEFKWKIPVQNSMPYIVEDIATQDKPGIAGTTFQIKLNDNCYGHSAILTYDKMNGVEFYVTEDPIIKVTDGWIYTVKMVNTGTDSYVDRKFLKSQTKIFRTGSARGEHSTHYDDFRVAGAGFREFYNYVGEAEASKQLSVSSWADVAKVRSEIVELYRVDDAYGIDPSITNIRDLVALKGRDFLRDKVKSGKVTMRWLPKMEAAALTELGRDIENYLMWGKGGKIQNVDGPTDVRLSVGLWKQLKSGYERVYTKANFNLDMFEAEIYNFFRGKVDFDGPDSGRRLIVQTGLAGMRLINKAIRDVINGLGFVQDASSLGVVTGKAMGLGFGVSYTHYKIPFLANIEFVVNKAFDNVNNNDIENPIIEGFPLSSYSFIIYDIDSLAGSDNIYLLKYAPGGDTRWSDVIWKYEQGDFPYLGIGAAKGFASVGDFSGYRVKMRQRYPAIWVKDPTKVLRIVMKNPITGGSL